jgi:uncharacterized membrane protein YdbT with pleckstrin-like domain
MAYVDKILLPDERVLCVTTVHWIVYTEGFLITIAGALLGYYGFTILNLFFGESFAQSMQRPMGFVAFFVVLMGVVLSLGAYMRQMSTELAVTNRRVIAKYGLISRATYEIMITRITGGNFDQTIMGRLLGFGTVIIHGAGGEISPFDEIGDPQGFYKALMSVLERSQK